MASPINNPARAAENARSRRPGVLVAALVLVLSAVAAYVAASRDPWAGRAASGAFRLTLDDQLAIEPSLIRFRLERSIELPFGAPRALACGSDDRIYVASRNGVHVLDPDGGPGQVIAVPDTPICVAVGGPRHFEPHRLYVGVAGAVHVFDAAGHPAGTWRLSDAGAALTSIAVAEQDVFVADASRRLVWRYDTDGNLRGRIGEPDSARGIPGFVVPSRHFDLAVGSARLLHIANPGKLRIDRYTYGGDLGGSWGEAKAALDGFFGCSNPAHFALLPDGRFVTSEKGIPRIKVYSAAGEFQSVVAGPRELGLEPRLLAEVRAGAQTPVFDVAADSRGRVLVLDEQAGLIRVFVENGAR